MAAATSPRSDGEAMIESNPYAPPKADDAAPSPAAGDKPAHKLYSPGQIFLATFLGAPLAGLYLLSENRKRLGHASLARMMLIGGIVLTAVLFAVSFVLPARMGNIMPMLAAYSVWHFAKQDSALIDAHQKKGGQMESGWKAAGIGLASMTALLVLLVLIASLEGEL